MLVKLNWSFIKRTVYRDVATIVYIHAMYRHSDLVVHPPNSSLLQSVLLLRQGPCGLLYFVLSVMLSTFISDISFLATFTSHFNSFSSLYIFSVLIWPEKNLMWTSLPFLYRSSFPPSRYPSLGTELEKFRSSPISMLTALLPSIRSQTWHQMGHQLVLKPNYFCSSKSSATLLLLPSKMHPNILVPCDSNFVSIIWMVPFVHFGTKIDLCQYSGILLSCHAALTIWLIHASHPKLLPCLPSLHQVPLSCHSGLYL